MFVSSRPFLWALLAVQLLHACTAQIEPGHVLRFNFQFGVFPEATGEPSESDIQGILCQTQTFFSQVVHNATDKPTVAATATQIDWSYDRTNNGTTTPLTVDFSVHFVDPNLPANADPAAMDTVFEELIVAELKQMDDWGSAFLENWLWTAPPVGSNWFLAANSFIYDGQPQPVEAVTQSKLEGVTCKDATTEEEEDQEGSSGNATEPLTPESPDSTNATDNTDPDTAPSSSGGAEEGLRYAVTLGEFTGRQEPSSDDVTALLCEMQRYFKDLVVNATSNTNNVTATISHVDWGRNNATSTTKMPVWINFTAVVQDQDQELSLTRVLRDTMEALNATESIYLLVHYVHQSESDYFRSTEVFGYDAAIEPIIPTLEPRMETVVCPKETLAPTVSPAPTHSSAPSLAPSVSPAPSQSPAPTVASSDTAAGGTEENGGVGGLDNNNNNATDASGTSPSGDKNETETPAGGAGTTPSGDTPGEDGSNNNNGLVQRETIQVAFEVSNVNGITEPAAVNASGLTEGFPALVQEVVRLKSARQRRRLLVTYVPDTAHVVSLVPFECDGLPGLTCHSAVATYQVTVTDNEEEDTKQHYTDATQLAVDDGTFQSTMEREVPDTPLFIGILTSRDQLPPGAKMGGGLPLWLLILIILLAILLCCCMSALIYYFCYVRRSNKDDEEPRGYEEHETVVEEEQVVETEYISKASRATDTDDEFLDEEAQHENEIAVIREEDSREFVEEYGGTNDNQDSAKDSQALVLRSDDD